MVEQFLIRNTAFVKRCSAQPIGGEDALEHDTGEDKARVLKPVP